jgi:hypothetical protein
VVVVVVVVTGGTTEADRAATGTAEMGTSTATATGIFSSNGGADGVIRLPPFIFIFKIVKIVVSS